MAKALRNEELVPPHDSSSMELDELARRPGRAQTQGVSAGPVVVPPGSQRPRELMPKSAAAEESASEKAAQWKQAAEEKIEELKQRGAQAANQVRSSASRTWENVRERTLAALHNGKQKSGELASSIRRRSRYVADEYPMQTIAAVAGVAFICGVLLRIWRSNRYE